MGKFLKKFGQNFVLLTRKFEETEENIKKICLCTVFKNFFFLVTVTRFYCTYFTTVD